MQALAPSRIPMLTPVFRPGSRAQLHNFCRALGKLPFDKFVLGVAHRRAVIYAPDATLTATIVLWGSFIPNARSFSPIEMHIDRDRCNTHIGTTQCSTVFLDPCTRALVVHEQITLATFSAAGSIPPLFSSVKRIDIPSTHNCFSPLVGGTMYAIPSVKHATFTWPVLPGLADSPTGNVGWVDYVDGMLIGNWHNPLVGMQITVVLLPAISQVS